MLPPERPRPAAQSRPDVVPVRFEPAVDEDLPTAVKGLSASMEQVVTPGGPSADGGAAPALPVVIDLTSHAGPVASGVIVVQVDGDAARTVWTIDSSHIADDDVDRIVEQFTSMLDALAEAPTRNLLDVDLVPAAEASQLRALGSRGRRWPIGRRRFRDPVARSG